MLGLLLSLNLSSLRLNFLVLPLLLRLVICCCMCNRRKRVLFLWSTFFLRFLFLLLSLSRLFLLALSAPPSSNLPPNLPQLDISEYIRSGNRLQVYPEDRDQGGQAIVLHHVSESRNADYV